MDQVLIMIIGLGAFLILWSLIGRVSELEKTQKHHSDAISDVYKEIEKKKKDNRPGLFRRK